MNETTNTNNYETISKIHKEYMYYNDILKKSFETSVNKATEMMDIAYEIINKNTDDFRGKYKKEIFRAGFESAAILINHVSNDLLKDVVKHLEDRAGDAAASSVEEE